MVSPTHRLVSSAVVNAVGPVREVTPPSVNIDREELPFWALDLLAERDIYEQLRRDNEARLYGMLALLGLSAHEAAEVVDATFARLLAGRNRMDLVVKAVPFLYRSALKSACRRLGEGEAAAPTCKIIRVVRQLPARQRDLAALCLYAGLSIEDAARTLRIQRLIAEIHLQSALDALRLYAADTIVSGSV